MILCDKGYAGPVLQEIIIIFFYYLVNRGPGNAELPGDIRCTSPFGLCRISDMKLAKVALLVI